jgi:hypothetical protein
MRASGIRKAMVPWIMSREDGRVGKRREYARVGHTQSHGSLKYADGRWVHREKQSVCVFWAFAEPRSLVGKMGVQGE